MALRRFSKAKAKARQQAGAGGGADKPQAAAGKRGREADQAGGASGSGALPAGAAQLPVVLTVNTRLEGLFEADVVSDHMWRQVRGNEREAGRVLLVVVGQACHACCLHTTRTTSASQPAAVQVYPLIPNPFCSLEALQSGTLGEGAATGVVRVMVTQSLMRRHVVRDPPCHSPLAAQPCAEQHAPPFRPAANDVYRKSAWMTVFELQPAAATKKPAGRQARKKTAWLATTGRKVRKAAGKAARKVKDAARAVAQMLPARWGRRT